MRPAATVATLGDPEATGNPPQFAAARRTSPPEVGMCLRSTGRGNPDGEQAALRPMRLSRLLGAEPEPLALVDRDSRRPRRAALPERNGRQVGVTVRLRGSGRVGHLPHLHHERGHREIVPDPPARRPRGRHVPRRNDPVRVVDRNRRAIRLIGRRRQRPRAADQNPISTTIAAVPAYRSTLLRNTPPRSPTRSPLCENRFPSIASLLWPLSGGTRQRALRANLLRRV